MNFKEISCEKDCKFQIYGGTTTDAYYPPIYDKDGNNTNPDGNVVTQKVECLNCKKEWTACTQYGKTIFSERKYL